MIPQSTNLLQSYLWFILARIGPKKNALSVSVFSAFLYYTVAHKILGKTRDLCVFFFLMLPWDPSTLLEDTPLKINMEHNHGGLEDHFPFYMGDL